MRTFHVRQSLDKIMEEQSYRVIDRMFRLNGFEVILTCVRYTHAQVPVNEAWRNSRYSCTHVTHALHARYMQVITLKYGKRLRAVFEQPGGQARNAHVTYMPRIHNAFK